MPSVKKKKSSSFRPSSSGESTATALYQRGEISYDAYQQPSESIDMPKKSGWPFGTPNCIDPPEPPADDLPDASACAPGDEPTTEDHIPPPSPAQESEWVMPSPPAEPLDGDQEEVKAAAIEVEEKHKNTMPKHSARKCWLWCFRCPPRLATHEFTFGDGMLPEWLDFDGGKDKSLVVPICCNQCNFESRSEGSNREEEEEKIRTSFANLKIGWDRLSMEAREMAEVREGREVALFTRSGKVAHIDIKQFRVRLIRDDVGETLDWDKFCKDKNSDFGMGKLVGGLF